ncbi:hypothetical protein CPC08DRAFT_704277 [Agrocybe pediades]|nr:hypothetical protein CPC08DRAFT_704277 [Agrocybe pediades]
MPPFPGISNECPVCLEPVSFRLPGEEPPVVPECGHALHVACFTAVYGPPPNQQTRPALPQKPILGLCGICRRPMKVRDGAGQGNVPFSMQPSPVSKL